MNHVDLSIPEKLIFEEYQENTKNRIIIMWHLCIKRLWSKQYNRFKYGLKMYKNFS